MMCVWEVSFDFQFKIEMKIENNVNLIRAPKVPFSFHFKIGMQKDIFRYFNFDSKLKIKK